MYGIDLLSFHYIYQYSIEIFASRKRKTVDKKGMGMGLEVVGWEKKGMGGGKEDRRDSSIRRNIMKRVLHFLSNMNNLV